MRKAAKNEIKAFLEKECNKLKADLVNNRYQMKMLVERQTLTKRKIAEYFALMKHLEEDNKEKK